MAVDTILERNFFYKRMNVKFALLYVDLDETIYMCQPDGFETSEVNKLCKLKNTIYGLKLASRAFRK